MRFLELQALLFLQVETVAIQLDAMYRLVSTESMLRSAWSVDILKDQTLNALFTFPPEGITDAIEELLASNHSKLEPIAGATYLSVRGRRCRQSVGLQALQSKLVFASARVLWPEQRAKGSKKNSV